MRKLLVGGSVPVVTLVAGLLFGAGATWACVPQPLVVIKPTASGPANSSVTVEGITLHGQVEVRWNGPDGELLATAEGPTVSAVVKIPEAPAGLYSIVVLERQAGGVLGSSGRASFLVTSGAPGGGGAGPASTKPGTATTRASSSGGPGIAVALAAAGAGVVAGGLGGATLARRRRAPAAT